jgi:RNA polymerase sigma-70 factor (ECF subfamily)
MSSSTTIIFGIPRFFLASFLADAATMASGKIEFWSARVLGTGGAIKSSAAILASEESQFAAQTRSTDALARFHRDIVPELDAAYNFARFLSRDSDAAQDIVQEAFLRAFRSFDGYNGGSPRAWIFTIVRNCYHDWLIDRRRKQRVEIDVHSKDKREANTIDEMPSDDDSPEMALLRRAESSAVRVVLGKLPRSLREMLVLRELEGLSYRQIGVVAALPIGTVMSRLARARKQFETAWREEFGLESQI